MIRPRYLSVFVLGTLLWCGLFLAFTWIIDPYGVSPVRISIKGVNAFKPKRLDIDRLIKPYEVWRYQPRTVFLGTSRITESIDPRLFENTRFGSAYNAAIPASILSENAAHIEQYFQLDKNLRYVFVELFIYNFINPNIEFRTKGFQSLISDTVSLNFSGAAVFSSIQTIFLNSLGRPIGPYIAPEGFWVRPKGLSTKKAFDAQLFTDTIMRIHLEIPEMIIEPTALQALDKIVAVCREHGAELYLIITPSYPWDDHRLYSLGYWPLLEQWLKTMSKYENVYSFAQYNNIIEEPAGADMKYWNDPIHFSMDTGRLMMEAFLGYENPSRPENLMRSVTPETVESVIRERRAGFEDWDRAHPDFVKMFDQAKFATKNDRSQRVR